MEGRLGKTGFNSARRGKKMVLLLAALGFTGYGVYKVYHLPSVARKRERISKILSALLSIAEAVSNSVESIGIVSKDLKRFLHSNSNQVPNSLRQMSKITNSKEFSQPLMSVTQALTVGFIRGCRSATLSDCGDVGAEFSSFTLQVIDKVFSKAGSGFASIVVGSFARNLVMAFFSDGHCSGGSNLDDSTCFGYLGSETDHSPPWVNVLCGDKCRELIGNCVQLFVSTAVAVFLDKTMAVNFCDELFSGLTSPKHEMKVRDMLVSISNGAVQTLVTTSHQVLTCPNSENSSSGPPCFALEKGSSPTGIENERLKPINSFAEEKDGGWMGMVSSTLAKPSNRRFVLDMTGRVTFETIRSFMEVVFEKLYEASKTCVNITREAVVDMGAEVARYATAKTSLVATVCLSLCLHILDGAWILVPSS
ncbi:Protein PHLOEM PROTEIN 2-LIKE A10 [Morella rubra]|uniref:Protein PHLOEM PROTEIN 2-LIKE A10 n=1 Tax=Morella rubra TaxID=262757 RepID=A0A6A1VPU8_9ROSI|nr:Protein PHLOEM PROTEIN 2-LIKE A10 [Morella rubra]